MPLPISSHYYASVGRRLALQIEARRHALRGARNRAMERRQTNLARAANSLALLSPLNVLARGYGIVQRGSAVVRDATALHTGDAISVRLAKGEIGATVTTLQPSAHASTKKT
jgi:exonuclease VII large subunit